MPRWLWLIIALALLYVMPSLILHVIYGPSYGFLSFSDRWAPDGNGGWKAEGFPDQRRPTTPSVIVPFFLRIVPVVLPMLLIVLYIASPLSQYVEQEPNYKATKYNPEEYRPDFVEEMPELEDDSKSPD